MENQRWGNLLYVSFGPPNRVVGPERFYDICGVGALYLDNWGCSNCVPLRPLDLTASVASVQPTSKTSSPQWSIPPVEQTFVRPIAVSRWHVRPANQDTAQPTKLPCCCSNCLGHSSSSSALAIYQSRTIQSWVKNLSLQSSLTLRTICFKSELTYLLTYSLTYLLTMALKPLHTTWRETRRTRSRKGRRKTLQTLDHRV